MFSKEELYEHKSVDQRNQNNSPLLSEAIPTGRVPAVTVSQGRKAATFPTPQLVLNMM